MLTNKAFWAATLAAIAAVFGYRSVVQWTDPVGRAPHKIAFITAGSSDYWKSAIQGATDAAEERGITLDVRMPEDDESLPQQMQILSVVSSSDVDAVAISPLDPDRQASIITQIATVKPIVTFDSDAAGSARHGYVGTSNFSAGLVAGTLIKRAIPEGGKIAVLMSTDSKENVAARRGGLQTRVAESPVADSPVDPRYTIVGFFSDNGDNEVCAEKIRELLEEHEGLACIVTLNSRIGPVAIRTLADLKADQVKLIAFDTLPETLEAVEQGKAFAAIAQDPYMYGYEAVGMLDALCRGDDRYLPVVGRGAIHVSVEPLMQDDVASFRTRMKSRRSPADKG